MKKITIMTLLGLLVASFYYSLSQTLGICIGAAWGYINLHAIKQLMHGLLIAVPKNYLKLFGIALVKFPLLYTLGYGLLLIKDLSPWNLLIGFSLVLALSTQRWFWHHLPN